MTPTSIGHKPLRLLVILQEGGYHLGRFGPLFRELGIEPRVLPAAEETLQAIEVASLDGLISLGGDMGAYEDGKHPQLRAEMDLMRRAHGAGTPILGICLGAQLLARAMGGEVRARRGGEVGWQDVRFLIDDPLLGPAGVRRKFLWHQDSFRAPPGATVIAATQECPHQAFRLGHSYGLQFHPEVALDQLRDWKTGPSGENLGIEPQQSKEILQEALKQDAEYAIEAARLVRGFVAQMRRLKETA